MSGVQIVGPRRTTCADPIDEYGPKASEQNGQGARGLLRDNQAFIVGERPGSMIAPCADARRPVTFLIERIEE
jgi:hypothetical protein